MSNITRKIEGFEIYQRESDGYLNATQICKVNQEITGHRKDPSEWLSNKSSKSIREKLSSITGIPVIKLVEQKTGKYGGTWIHPRLAVRFSMWVNDDFSLQVEDWVQEWLLSNTYPLQTIVPVREPSLEEIDRLFSGLYKLNIRPELVESVKLTAVGLSIPRLAIAAEQGKQLISVQMKTSETPVSPRKLGQLLASTHNLPQTPSAQKINNSLVQAGLQYRKGKEWELTELGTKYGQKQFDTAKNHSKTVVCLRWFSSVLTQIEKDFI